MTHITKTMVLDDDQDLDSVRFSKQDAIGITPHKDDSMVMKIQIHDLTVERVLVDPGSSTDILYREAFRGVEFDIVELFPFMGTLVNFDGEKVHIMGHLLALTTF